MGMQEVMSWYQKKIGTYDKQQWERTIEQRILHGLTHVPKKSAKLKTELIDVDLVRGSSFPKAKPKHGLITVARLACLRLIFLPVYGQWWVGQTSPRVFTLLLSLYFLQLLGGALYFYCCSSNEDGALENVTASEVLVPVAMMFILSIIHSQIVSTHNGTCRRLSSERPRCIRRKRNRRQPSSSRSRANLAPEKPDSLDKQMTQLFQKKEQIKRTTSDGARRLPVMWENSANSKKRADLVITTKTIAESSSAADGESQSIRHQGIEETHSQNENTVTVVDDDGFESLTGNGSSENGEGAIEEGYTEKCKQTSISRILNSNSALSIDGADSVTELSQQSSFGLKHIDKCSTFEDDDVSLDRISEKSYQHTPAVADITATQSVDELRREKKFWSKWVQQVLVSRNFARDGNHADNETDGSDTEIRSPIQRTVKLQSAVESSYNSSCESEGQVTERGSYCHLLAEATASAGEWMGVTTNSEECSYSSDLDETDSQHGSTELNDHPFAWEFGLSPSVILSPNCAASDKVSCTVWERHDVKKADLSVLDISSAIIARVEAMPENTDYFYAGVLVSVLLALLPSACRLVNILSHLRPNTTSLNGGLTAENITMGTGGLISNCLFHISESLVFLSETALGGTLCERVVMLIAGLERFALSILFFFLLAVAERTFKQRFLYAKLFSHLTSFRRAQKSELPHFRLNKVRNIKTWLSVRSYLRKRGPQRSVDMIVSAAFLITLLLLSFLSVEFLKVSVDENTCDSEDASRLHSQYSVEAMVWCMVLGVYLLRFMTLGTKINHKYSNLSVLITEQINLYLQIEQKPHKKEELMVANSVLKLAADLLKELESPFKISGLSANPYLYTITKVVILSALSGALSEILGFKLKLHKIKIK